MATTTVTNLTELAAKLERELGSAAGFGAVSTRLLLRTGVNLCNPKPEQINDRAVVSRMAQAMAEMGYRF